MKRQWRIRVIFLVGLLLCCLPMVYNLITQRRQADAVATYKSAIDNQEDNLEQILNEAKEYNSMLWQSSGAVMDDLNMDILSNDNYEKLLDVSDTGMMGSLDIPKINVNLPIYHGTSDEVLSNGIGHLQGTSLPVGGENTHSVLTGHRGLPQSKLLTRLDEMKEGDYFFIHVCNETLAYKVCKIQVVEPEDVSSLQIQGEKDLVSLITCTPYGINTKRLIVTGERVSYEKAEYQEIKEAVPSIRELILTFLPAVFIILLIIFYIKDRRNQRYEDEKI